MDRCYIITLRESTRWRCRRSAFSRRRSPELCFDFTLKEGAGKTGCALHPRSRVQDGHKKTHTSIQVQRRQSGLPCAVVLTVSFVLSPVTGFLATVAALTRAT